jgi:hypothetical protein
MPLSATGVTEIAKSTHLNRCPHTFGHVVYHSSCWHCLSMQWSITNVGPYRHQGQILITLQNLWLSAFIWWITCKPDLLPWSHLHLLNLLRKHTDIYIACHEKRPQQLYLSRYRSTSGFCPLISPHKPDPIPTLRFHTYWPLTLTWLQATDWRHWSRTWCLTAYKAPFTTLLIFM